jgi:hypothetical protein
VLGQLGRDDLENWQSDGEALVCDKQNFDLGVFGVVHYIPYLVEERGVAGSHIVGCDGISGVVVGE